MIHTYTPTCMHCSTLHDNHGACMHARAHLHAHRHRRARRRVHVVMPSTHPRCADRIRKRGDAILEREHRRAREQERREKERREEERRRAEEEERRRQADLPFRERAFASEVAPLLAKVRRSGKPFVDPVFAPTGTRLLPPKMRSGRQVECRCAQ